jgi:hypothetical protein
MEQTMEALDRITHERDRINALHDAIAIIVAEVGNKDFALGTQSSVTSAPRNRK